MKIKGIQKVDVEITEEERETMVVDYLQEKYKVNPWMWIQDGNLMDEVEYISSHKWYSKEVVREATSLDKAVLKILKDIKGIKT